MMPSGVVFTILLAGFIVLALPWWWGQRPQDHSLSPARLRHNELRAFDNLRRVAEAQPIYFEKSKSLFGQARYAAFVTHLWTAVNPRGKAVRLDLIPMHLAVAVGTTKAIDGYYFVDIRERVARQANKVHIVDYRREWLVAGLPQQAGLTGNLVFMVDQSQRIFARPSRTFSSIYPLDPEADGWSLISTSEDLKAFQKNAQSSEQR
jgi:hypothetical protein